MTDDASNHDPSGSSEPAPAEATAVAGSGALALPSPPSPSTPGRDLLRALACALLVAMSVSSPEVAFLLAPFVPALVALRLVRRDPAGRFLGSCVAATLVATVFSVPSDALLGASVAGALIAVPVLGLVHARAARIDPVDQVEQPVWPEPRLTSGFTLAAVAWIAATACVVVVVLGTVGSSGAADAARGAVDDAYRPYVQACRDGGALASRADLCEAFTSQRADVRRLVSDHAADVLAVLAAVFAFGAAATAHLVVLGRARRRGDRVRARWRIDELEVHWGWAYLAALGLGGVLLADGSSDVGGVVRSISIALAVLGALAVVTQGVGLIAWFVRRAPRRTLLWITIAVLVLVASPVVFTTCLAFGMLDMAMRPRRRALEAEC